MPTVDTISVNRFNFFNLTNIYVNNLVTNLITHSKNYLQCHHIRKNCKNFQNGKQIYQAKMIMREFLARVGVRNKCQ